MSKVRHGRLGIKSIPGSLDHSEVAQPDTDASAAQRENEGCSFGLGAVLSVVYARMLADSPEEVAELEDFLAGDRLSRSSRSREPGMHVRATEVLAQHPDLGSEDTRLEVEALDWALWWKTGADCASKRSLQSRWLERQRRRLGEVRDIRRPAPTQ